MRNFISVFNLWSSAATDLCSLQHFWQNTSFEKSSLCKQGKMSGELAGFELSEALGAHYKYHPKMSFLDSLLVSTYEWGVV